MTHCPRTVGISIDRVVSVARSAGTRVLSWLIVNATTLPFCQHEFDFESAPSVLTSHANRIGLQF